MRNTGRRTCPISHTKEYAEGFRARHGGQDLNTNPYPDPSSDEWDCWFTGWLDANEGPGVPELHED